jgi:proteic killer suppression protein
MRISFKNKKLCKQLTQSKELHKLGPRRAGLVQRRLSEIEASDNLAVLKLLPGPRLHPLKGNRLGQLSVDLDHPYRLIFVPDHEPIPELEAGGMDWKAITAVKIIEITDTHE